MGYWACARLEPHRERLALHCLALASFKTYFPRIRERRRSHGRKIEVRSPLFPGYCFLTIEAQWHAARWSVGVLGLIGRNSTGQGGRRGDRGAPRPRAQRAD